ncbi:helix-turn-helix domain-containing protein [Kitasatospora sp. NPDC058243]|uniref:helix-turn-helix domain-containing protein n=1 Tax=Kitasatospora sp. NPDC058243 TaxID=3346397 RepID=UPI0036D9BB48
MAEQESQPAEREPAPSAAEALAAELRRLRLEAGQPSFRTMAKTAGSISHTTLYEAASGSRLPSWTTTRAYVRACGGDEAEWHRRWTSAADEGSAPPALPALPAPPAPPVEPSGPPVAANTTADSTADTTTVTRADSTAASAAEPPAGPGRGRRRIWTHAFCLLLGVALGVGSTLAVVGFRTPDAPPPSAHGCPSGDTESAPAEAAARPAPGPRPAAARTATDDSAPSWASRVAFDQQAVSSTEVVLPVLSPVTPGDALVVTMMLTSTCPGAVTVTDSRGDRFRIVGDVTDSLRHRVLLLAAFGAAALTAEDSIRVAHPRASKYHVAVDEFRGVSAVRAVGRASGDAGGTTFSTAANAAACAPGDLLVSTVGSNSGSAPEFGTSWTSLPALRLSSYRLTTAHRIATDPDHCAATGQTTSQWGAVLAVLR